MKDVVIILCFFISGFVYSQNNECIAFKDYFYKEAKPYIDSLRKLNNFNAIDERLDLLSQEGFKKCPCVYWSTKAILRDRIAYNFFRMNQRKKAFQLFDDYIAKCQNVNDSTQLYLKYQRALFHLMDSDYAGMKRNLDEALYEGGQHFDVSYRDFFATRVNYALYYNWKNDFNAALDIYLENEELVTQVAAVDTAVHIDNLLGVISMAQNLGIDAISEEYTEKLLALTKNTKYDKNAKAELNAENFIYYVKKEQLDKAAHYHKEIAPSSFDSDYNLGIHNIIYLISRKEEAGAREKCLSMEKAMDYENVPKHHFFRINLNFAKLKFTQKTQEEENELIEHSMESLYYNYINLVNEALSVQSNNIRLILSKYEYLIDYVTQHDKPQYYQQIYEKLSNLKNISNRYFEVRRKLFENSQNNEMREDFEKYKKLIASQNLDIIQDSIEYYSARLQQHLEDNKVQWHTNLKLTHLRDNLEDDDVFLDYYQIIDRSQIPKIYVFVITKNEFGFYLYSHPEDSLRIHTLKTNYTNNGNLNLRLYNYLIRPIESHLKDKKRLLIAPDGVFNTIAFEVLSSIGKKSQLLNDQYQIKYVENAYSIIKKNRQKINAVPDNPNFTIIGGIRYNCIKAGGTEAPYLSGSASEVKLIVQKMKDQHLSYQVFDQCNATKRNLQKCLQDENISHVHISTHGVIKKSNLLGQDFYRSNSAVKLLLAQDSVDVSTPDITALDIVDMDLTDKQLVFLSACDSGVGNYMAGLGNASIANAIKTAGATTVIATLWPVDDRVATEVCDQFYSYYLSGYDAYTSMDLTKASLRKHYSPEKWAAFRVID